MHARGALGVPPSRWVASEGVGAHLSDHVISQLTFTSTDALHSPSATATTTAQYLATRSGIYAQYGPTGVAYLRCDDLCDPPSPREDVEVFVGPATAGGDGAGGDGSDAVSTFTVALMLLAPSTESRLAFAAETTAAEAEVYADVYLRPGRDVEVMASAANRTIHAVLASGRRVALRKFGSSGGGELPACDTADGHCRPGEPAPMANIRRWLTDGWDPASNNRNQVNHYAGTCAVGECASEEDARVLNTTNVHVADGSLLRYQLRAHPVLTVMALAVEVAERMLRTDPNAYPIPPMPPPATPPPTMPPPTMPPPAMPPPAAPATTAEPSTPALSPALSLPPPSLPPSSPPLLPPPSVPPPPCPSTPSPATPPASPLLPPPPLQSPPPPQSPQPTPPPLAPRPPSVPSPLAPGASIALLRVVHTVVLAGSVEAFDALAYRRGLAGLLTGLVDLDAISLSVRPASVVVVATMTLPTEPLATETRDRLNSTTTTQLSSAVGAAVERVEPTLLLAVRVAAPSPPPPVLEWRAYNHNWQPVIISLSIFVAAVLCGSACWLAHGWVSARRRGVTGTAGLFSSMISLDSLPAEAASPPPPPPTGCAVASVRAPTQQRFKSTASRQVA